MSFFKSNFKILYPKVLWAKFCWIWWSDFEEKKRKCKSLQMEIETNAGHIVIKRAHFCSILNSDTNLKNIYNWMSKRYQQNYYFELSIQLCDHSIFLHTNIQTDIWCHNSDGDISYYNMVLESQRGNLKKKNKTYFHTQKFYVWLYSVFTFLSGYLRCYIRLRGR